MKVLPLQLQIPSLAIPTDPASSSSSLSWSGLQCRIPLLVSKPAFPSRNGNPGGQVRMMGGGPRTFPGGVTKWQWKRMQDKKAKQLLKARLLRERQLYEMRKRAELKAATVELEKPWEKRAKAPNLFAVTADEQLQALADRFQKPGGFDLWTETDGPQSFRTVDGQPSARFFPKGAVHSTVPYSRVHSTDSGDARSSRSETPFQAREYAEKPRVDGSKLAKGRRQRCGSSPSDRMNLESNEGPGSQRAHQHTGKRQSKGSFSAEDAPGRRVSSFGGADSKLRQSNYSQRARDFSASRAAAASNLANGSRQTHGSEKEEAYGMDLSSRQGNYSGKVRSRGIRFTATGSNFVKDRGQRDEVLEDESYGMDLNSSQGKYPQRARDYTRNHEIDALGGSDLADDSQWRDRSPFEEAYDKDLNSMHGSSSPNVMGFAGKPRQSSGRMSNFAGFEL